MADEHREGENKSFPRLRVRVVRAVVGALRGRWRRRRAWHVRLQLPTIPCPRASSVRNFESAASPSQILINAGWCLPDGHEEDDGTRQRNRGLDQTLLHYSTTTVAILKNLTLLAILDPLLFCATNDALGFAIPLDN